MKLEEIQEIALSRISSETGHLDIHDRQKMWESLGPVTQQRAAHTPGHIGRVVLFLECLRLLIPYWKKCEVQAKGPLVNPEDSPLSTIKTAERWIHDEIDPEELHENSERLQDLMPYVANIQQACFNAALIIASGADVLWAADKDVASDYPEDYAEEDDEIWHADFFAAWVYSGAPLWEKDASGRQARRRRKFWTWYVNDAFRKAWDASRSTIQ